MLNFLIVDDAIAFRRILYSLVQAQVHWRVAGEADNGLEAVALITHQSIDVVLMDINLPHMNGIEATRRIKQLAPRTRILMISGYDDEELRQQSLLVGADYYLRKEDVNADMLYQLVASLFPRIT